MSEAETTSFSSKTELLNRLYDALYGARPLTHDDIVRLNNTDTSAWADPTDTVAR